MRRWVPKDIPKKNPPSFRRALIRVAIFMGIPLTLIALHGH
jgi:hypothetical protein